MAVAVTFNPAVMSTAQYDECIKRLAEAGEGAPAGRLYHVCYKNGELLQVFDLWDSQESFARFGQTLLPILHELGIDPGQPSFSEVHNVVEG